MNLKLLKPHNENIKKTKDIWGMEEWAFTLKLETSLKAELLGMKIKTDTHLKTV